MRLCCRNVTSMNVCLISTLHGIPHTLGKMCHDIVCFTHAVVLYNYCKNLYSAYTYSAGQQHFTSKKSKAKIQNKIQSL